MCRCILFYIETNGQRVHVKHHNYSETGFYTNIITNQLSDLAKARRFPSCIGSRNLCRATAAPGSTICSSALS